MSIASYDGVVAFEPLPMERQGIMLGVVRVGEIAPSNIPAPTSRFEFCFRLDLPGISSTAWMPARNIADARRQAAEMINDWMMAAGLAPIGRVS